MVSVNQLALRQASPLPRLRQQPLSEVEPLRELADLRLEPEHAIFEVRHSPVRRTGPDPGIRNFPPYDPPPVAIAEIARRDDNHVVQIPDPHPAEGEAHPNAALGTAGVKTVQAEHAAEDRQPERQSARALGHRSLRRARLRWLHRLVARQRAGCHVAGPESPARASSACRGIAPACRPASRPCRKTISVGIARMPKRCVVAGLRSVSSFTTNTSPWRSRAKSSSTGAMILQGPHQSAYPSMTTGTSVPLRTASSVASVTAMGRSSRIGRPQLPHLGRSVMRVRSTRLSVPQNGQTTVARLLTSVTDTAHLHRESTCLVARSLPPRFPRASRAPRAGSRPRAWWPVGSPGTLRRAPVPPAPNRRCRSRTYGSGPRRRATRRPGRARARCS